MDRICACAAVAVVAFVAGCGGRQHVRSGDRTASGGSVSAKAIAVPPGADVTVRTSPAPPRPRAGSAPRRLSPATAVRVERVSRALTSVCVEETDPVHLSATLKRLPRPLAIAQMALLKAERTATSLARRDPRGTVALEVLGAARARVQTLEAINYAIERNDPSALGVGLGTGVLLSHQLDTLARTYGPRACA